MCYIFINFISNSIKKDYRVKINFTMIFFIDFLSMQLSTLHCYKITFKILRKSCKDKICH